MNSYKKIVSIVLFTGFASISLQQAVAVNKKETQVAVKEEDSSVFAKATSDRSKLIDLPKELIFKILGLSLETEEDYKNIGEVLLFKKLVDQEVLRRSKMSEDDFADLSFMCKTIERLKILLANVDSAYKGKNGYENVLLLASKKKLKDLERLLVLAGGYPMKIGNKTYEKAFDKICFVREKNGANLASNDIKNELEGLVKSAIELGICTEDSSKVITIRNNFMPLGVFYKTLFEQDIVAVKKLLEAGAFPYGNFVKQEGLWHSSFELDKTRYNYQEKIETFKEHFFDFIQGKRTFCFFDFSHLIEGLKDKLQEVYGKSIFSEGVISEKKVSLLMFSPLHAAAYLGNLEMVKLFIDAGVDVDFKTYDITPLFIAALQGHQEIVEYLLEQGARVNEKCYKGKTALHGAMMSNNMKIAQQLFQAGAEVSVRDNDGKMIFDVISDELKIALIKEALTKQ